MKNIIKKRLIAATVTISLLIVGCSDFTDGINESPNSFTEAPGTLLIGQAELQVVNILGGQSSRNAGIFTDQFTGADRQYISINNYTVVAGQYDDSWDDIYASGLIEARKAKEFAIKSGDKALEGVSKIMEAILLGEAASLWGDVPNTEATNYSEFPNPTYDAQADVFNYVQTLLSEAINDVGSKSVIEAYGTPVFVGNSANWGKIAHSLKARYFLVTKNYPMALTESKKGIDNASGDLLANYADAAGAKNLYYQFTAEEREGYLDVSGPSYMYELITGAKPRRLVTPGDTKRADVYFDGSELNVNAGGYFAADATYPIISFLETKLIEAEAEQRVNGGSAGEPAFTEVRNYLASKYNGAFPPSTSTGNDLTLEILEEKYLSLPGSLQIFHDARRTKNALGIPIKNTNASTLPQRYLYPQIEINSNENFPGLIDLYTPTPVNQ